MRKILNVSVLLSLIFFACKQTKKSDDGSVQKELDKSIVEIIKAHYHKDYEKSRLEEEITDSVVYLTYYNIPSAENTDDGIVDGLFIYWISGDLNNDGTDELLASVGTITSDNANDLFLFEKKGTTYVLIDQTNFRTLTVCKNKDGFGGYFIPKEIKDNYLIGYDYCYKESDARCCPSLEYLTKFVLKDGKLVFHSRGAVKDQEYTAYTYEDTVAHKYDASLPTSQYFRIEKINTAQFLDDGRLELEIDLKNIYQYKFSQFYLNATTFIKLKNREKYCKSYSQRGDDIAEYRIFDWQPKQTKRLKIYTPRFGGMGYCYALNGFNRTPEDMYIELSTSAISIEDEPEGVFARFDLMDLWKKKQKELIEKGTL